MTDLVALLVAVLTAIAIFALWQLVVPAVIETMRVFDDLIEDHEDD